MHQPDAERFLGVDPGALQHHLEGDAPAHQPRQTLRAAGAGDDAKIDLGLTDGGLAVIDHDPVVA